MPLPAAEQTARREALTRLLTSGRFSRQSEIVARLRKQGFNATQSSVSRDLRSLGVTKDTSGYRLPGESERSVQSELRQLSELVRGASPAGANLLVLHTAIGAASRIALTLDRSELPEIVGTISGDDTIFIATRHAKDQRKLLALIETLLSKAQP